MVFFEKFGVGRSKNQSNNGSYGPDIYIKKEALEFITRLNRDKDMPYDFSIDKQLTRAYDFAFGYLEYDGPSPSIVRGCVLRTFCFYSGSIMQAALSNKLFLNSYFNPFAECFLDRQQTRRPGRSQNVVSDEDLKNERFCSECENKLCQRCLKGSPEILAAYGNSVALRSALIEETKNIDFLINPNQSVSGVAMLWLEYTLNPLLYHLLKMENYNGDWDRAANQILEFVFGLEYFIDHFQTEDVTDFIKAPVVWASQLIFDVLKATHTGVRFPYADKSINEMRVLQTSKTLSVVWSNLLTNGEYISFPPTDYRRIAERIATINDLLPK